MLTFVTDKKPFAISLYVCVVLGCRNQYFSCVDFEATQCANGTYNVIINDTEVTDFVADEESNFQPFVISEQDIDGSAMFVFTPPVVTP